MKTILLILTLLFTLISIHSLASVVDRIVAVVNNEIITLSDLNESIATLKRVQEVSDPEIKIKELSIEEKKTILENLIIDKLMDMEAQRIGIFVDPDEVEEYIGNIRKRYSLTYEDFLQSLKKDNITIEKFKEEIKKRIMRNKLVNREIRSQIEINENDIIEFYEANKIKFPDDDKIRLSIIMLIFPSNISDKDKEGIRNKAKEIKEKAQRGEDFAKLARDFSEIPSAKDGGDLGDLKIEELDPVYNEKLVNVKDGDVSDIIETPKGISIIKVIERKMNKTKPLDKVREEIKNILFKEKMDYQLKKWIEKLRKNAAVEIKL